MDVSSESPDSKSVPTPSAYPRQGNAASPGRPQVLVTGASGFLGSRFVPYLLAHDHPVRVLSRDRSRVPVAWTPSVDVVEGDLSSPGDARRALRGIDVAYYFVHSMESAGRLVARETSMASTFADAAAREGVRRIVYLGGITPRDPAMLSEHLRSREAVGEVFLGSATDSIVLRASAIVSKGSTSFDIIRLASRLMPPMTAVPSWLETRVQPIALDDVLSLLRAAASVQGVHNRSFDIAGPDVLTYRRMVARVAVLAGGLPRLLVPLPAPALPALGWQVAASVIAGMTSLPREVVAHLLESTQYDMIARDRDFAELAGVQSRPITFDRAVLSALGRLQD